MKRGIQYHERGRDQLALPLPDLASVTPGIEVHSRRLNAQPENLTAAATHHGMKVRIKHKQSAPIASCLMDAMIKRITQ
ncbi:hypothetical protein O4H66_19735 [Comamonadaceae bacterium G21597-S1]|nr:hypothetical protein [Comamonadaceae bacterium G21597-S1]